MLKNLVYASEVGFILLLTIFIPVGQTAATKSSAYDSGYNHGCSDARNGDQYINTPGKGASFHTAEFMRGYDDGHSVCSSSGSGGSMRSPPSESPSGGGGGSNTGTNWMDLCNKISFALQRSCDELVNPDNTLTSVGRHAHDCIQNGALLAGGALLIGVPPTAIVSGLPIAAQMFGCGDVVNFDVLTLGNLKQLGQIFR
jgi:hypothetical protein